MIVPPQKFTILDMFYLKSDLEDTLKIKVDIISENSYTKELNKEASDAGIKAKEIFYKNVVNDRKLIYD